MQVKLARPADFTVLLLFSTEIKISEEARALLLFFPLPAVCFDPFLLVKMGWSEAVSRSVGEMEVKAVAVMAE